MLNVSEIKLVVIGVSAGGIDALKILLPQFKTPSKVSVALVLHLPPTGPNLLPELFRDQCEFKVKEAESGEEILAEHIYIAPPNYHLSVELSETLSLSNEEPVNYSRPAIDILFESAAHAYKDKVLGIILTGANHDGAEGLNLISQMGGMSLIQDPKTAEYPIMPESALKLVSKPSFIGDLSAISEIISGFKL